MKKSEKLIAGLVTMALGVLLIILKANIISILITILVVGLIVLGALDLYHKLVPPGVIKIVVGVVIILCGWLIVSAVLYLLAAVLLIAGILMLYEQIKKGACKELWKTVCAYAVPAVFIIIGLLLMFNQGNTVNWVFIISGVLTVVEGGLLLVNSIIND